MADRNIFQRLASRGLACILTLETRAFDARKVMSDLGPIINRPDDE